MQRALKAVVRRGQVMDFAMKCRANNRPQFTVSEVARALGVRPSTKLRAIIRPLVDAGLLHEHVEMYVGAVPVRYIYEVPVAVYNKHQQAQEARPRTIRINGNPQSVVLS